MRTFQNIQVLSKTVRHLGHKQFVPGAGVKIRRSARLNCGGECIRELEEVAITVSFAVPLGPRKLTLDSDIACCAPQVSVDALLMSYHPT